MHIQIITAISKLYLIKEILKTKPDEKYKWKNCFEKFAISKSMARIGPALFRLM